MSQDTIYELVRARFESLTRAERQLANSLLENYPVSGLASITTIAKNADVSAPTVVRMVQKLGFKGFPDFQSALRLELEAKISDPIAKHERWAAGAPDQHVLNRFGDAVLQNLHQTLSHLDPTEFDGVCAMLSQRDRRVFVSGGRITNALADYLFAHLQMIRGNVIQVPTAANSWPHYVLDMVEGDILIIFDIRRYENHMLRVVELAREKKVDVILFTDQWGSPIAQFATHSFNCRIEVPSAWDSVIAMMAVVEAMIAQIQQSTWQTTETRMRDLELLFDKTRLFRKFK